MGMKVNFIGFTNVELELMALKAPRGDVYDIVNAPDVRDGVCVVHVRQLAKRDKNTLLFSSIPHPGGMMLYVPTGGASSGYHLAGQLPPIYCVVDQFEHVFRNLCPQQNTAGHRGSYVALSVIQALQNFNRGDLTALEKSSTWDSVKRLTGKKGHLRECSICLMLFQEPLGNSLEHVGIH